MNAAHHQYKESVGDEQEVEERGYGRRYVKRLMAWLLQRRQWKTKQTKQGHRQKKQGVEIETRVVANVIKG